MGELPMETAVFSPSDSGSVVQLEGTVGCQLRKSSRTSGGMSVPEIAVSGGEEWSSLDMRASELLSFASLSPAFMCDTALGFFFLKSTITSSACKSSQSTHWFSDSGYPFHLTRYCTLRPLPNLRDCRISSTLYSSSPSIRSGGGLVKFGPWSSVS